jgi:hypothetical protein
MNQLTSKFSHAPVDWWRFEATAKCDWTPGGLGLLALRLMCERAQEYERNVTDCLRIKLSESDTIKPTLTFRSNEGEPKKLRFETMTLTIPTTFYTLGRSVGVVFSIFGEVAFIDTSQDYEAARFARDLDRSNKEMQLLIPDELILGSHKPFAEVAARLFDAARSTEANLQIVYENSSKAGPFDGPTMADLTRELGKGYSTISYHRDKLLKAGAIQNKTCFTGRELGVIRTSVKRAEGKRKPNKSLVIY